MPGVIYTDTVSGAGSATCSGNRVYYVAYQVNIEGPRVRRPQEADTLTLNGVGFVQLGNDLSSGGIISADGWGPQMWLNNVYGQYIANGGEVASGFMRWLADRIRWSLSPGTEVRLVVLGDSA